MSLQLGRMPVDSVRMELTGVTNTSGSSDQALVDLYAIHAPGNAAIEMTENQNHEASEAAHALELRGDIEQAGVSFHDSRPTLRATAQSGQHLAARGVAPGSADGTPPLSLSP
jgi:hypothetical protein